ncbi:MAG TPA: hypothetical protein VFP63_05990 [Dehalococcoidia bacterium]|nr:hypothetical protein [Dehalococcoidia bacterium]
MNGGDRPSETGVPRRLYAESFDATQRAEYEQALAMEGLAEEIALLRVRLKAAAGDEKTDIRVLAHFMNALVRAVSAEYRLSPRARKDLADNVAAVLNSLGDQLLPADL